MQRSAGSKTNVEFLHFAHIHIFSSSKFKKLAGLCTSPYSVRLVSNQT